VMAIARKGMKVKPEFSKRAKSGLAVRYLTKFAASLFTLLLMTGCAVGPKYHVPPTPAPPVYKELTPENFKDTDGWKQAQPQDNVIHGKWWEIFSDPELNALEEQVNISNQNIAASFASFLEARALVNQARSQYFPTVTVNPSITSNRALELGSSSATSSSGSGAGNHSSTTAVTYPEYSLPFDASWTPDLWGRIRNTVRGNVASAQASAADLENTRLTAQAEVAVDYYELRTQDALKQLLDSTVVAYKESLKLTQVLYRTGIDSDESVAQAETQLETTEAQDTNLGIARAQYEHAIALLVGKPASTFSIPVEPLRANPPAIPFGLPSQLLERRPDVAADERLMVQANAQIGVAKAAYFPTVTLTATAGLESSSIASWFTWPSRFWSVGPALAETIFDAGLRRATVQQYQAAWDQAVANYRETVLTAFQQVEDNLAALRILSQEIQQQDAAVKSAQRNLTVATNRYKLGIDPYLNVITAQTTLLSNQQTAVNLRMQQMTASVQLIEALGGGWSASQLPTPKELIAKTPQHSPP
jgi:NodT family efflux transporter outer membrane factor (OMF) lipoprotein